MGVVYRPVVRWTGSCFTAGPLDPVTNTNFLTDMEEKKNGG
jgi:hypothetical protein